ncbi:hypothetical protein OG21DRAFT_168872 [Imleria badia]|nr:hypothetical protein OG21DRAFT_168872 [Imleria badia]
MTEKTTATLVAHPVLVLRARTYTTTRQCPQTQYSPTNPFGRIRRLTQGTTLPIPTSLSKRLPLRFRFIHPRVDGREIDSDRDGIYHTVQVPLNYTLAHLRKLIEYILDPAMDAEIVESHNLRRSSRGMSSSSKGKQVGLEDPVRHLFEIQRKIKMGLPGQIKTAQTWTTTSTMCDSLHYPGTTRRIVSGSTTMVRVKSRSVRP